MHSFTYAHPLERPVSVCVCTTTDSTGAADSSSALRLSAVVPHARLPCVCVHVQMECERGCVVWCSAAAGASALQASGTYHEHGPVHRLLCCCLLLPAVRDDGAPEAPSLDGPLAWGPALRLYFVWPLPPLGRPWMCVRSVNQECCSCEAGTGTRTIY